MSQRFLFAAALCGIFAAGSAQAIAADLYAQLFPLTGEIRLLNREEAAVPFVFYSITSENGALNGSSAVWKSITENYDQPAGATPGNGFIDPNGDWIKLSSAATQLSEGALDFDGGRLPAMRAVSLGLIWDPYAVAFPDLVFNIWNDAQAIPVTIELALDGDYSPDHVVDLADYIAWRRYFGSTNMIADGNLNGVVDEADYLIWYANYGLTLPLPPYGNGGGGSAAAPSSQLAAGAVPEPTSAVLLLLACGGLPIVARRRIRKMKRS